MADSDAEQLESLLAKVMRQVTMQLDAPVSGLAGTPLSSAEGSLLVELLAAGEVTQQQIASRLHVDKSRVSRLCTALERKGLLARERDESNRRNLRVHVTESGEKAATQLRQAWRAYHEQMLAAMTPRERRALLVGLAAFARQLAALHAAGHHETAEVLADPAALRGLAKARESEQAGDVVYGTEAARALLAERRRR